MIEFLQDYTTESVPPETFKKGEQKTRSEESERYFVGRGLAGYLVDGKLVDADRRPIVTTVATIEIVQPGDRRADLAVRAGEVMTGQPPRASSGPGVPFVEPVGGIAGSPAVVLEAEIERLKVENAQLKTDQATYGDSFAVMNNSHVAAIDGVRTERDDARRELEALKGDFVTLQGQLIDANTVRGSLTADLDTAKARIGDLERDLAEATKPVTPAEDNGGTSDAATGKSARGKV